MTPDDSPENFLQTIRTYYHGCNTADVSLMCSTFDDAVVHYFVDHKPVCGAAELANYWAKVGPKTRAHWNVDRFLGRDEEAVIEWSMRWTPRGSGEQELLRGSEWFVFRNGKILEIRSYHNNVYLQSPDNAELHGFPYQSRGYTSS